MDNGDDRCVEDSCRFVVKMTFNLRPNLKGELIEFDKGWHEYLVAAYANRDLPGTMSIFADDVNMSFQGAPDAKKANLEKSYRDEFAHPEQSRKWIPKFEEFQCSGNLGFVRSTWRLEVTSAEGKVEIKEENRSVDILRLSEDGTWKIFRSLNYPVVAPKK